MAHKSMLSCNHWVSEHNKIFVGHASWRSGYVPNKKQVCSLIRHKSPGLCRFFTSVMKKCEPSVAPFIMHFQLKLRGPQMFY